MASGMLENAIQEMINKAEQAVVTAAAITSQQVKKDFEKAARDTVDNYYKYTNGGYTKYGRQYSLYAIPETTIDIKTNKNGGATITANISLDSSRISGNHRSHGQGAKYAGGVSSDYIFENFMANQHPWTNAWPLFGAEELEYRLIDGEGPSPDVFLSKYIQCYGADYAGKYFEKTVMQLLKLYF